MEIKAYSLAGLGHAYGLQKRFDEAFAHLNESLELFRALNHIPGQGWTLSRLGTVALHSGDYAKAEAWFSEQAGLMRAAGNPMYLDYALKYGAYALLARHWLAWIILLWVWIGYFTVNMLMKARSLSRYPDWKEYKKQTGLLLPKIFYKDEV